MRDWCSLRVAESHVVHYVTREILPDLNTHILTTPAEKISNGSCNAIIFLPTTCRLYLQILPYLTYLGFLLEASMLRNN